MGEVFFLDTQRSCPKVQQSTLLKLSDLDNMAILSSKLHTMSKFISGNMFSISPSNSGAGFIRFLGYSSLIYSTLLTYRVFLFHFLIVLW